MQPASNRLKNSKAVVLNMDFMGSDIWKNVLRRQPPVGGTGRNCSRFTWRLQDGVRFYRGLYARYASPGRVGVLQDDLQEAGAVLVQLAFTHAGNAAELGGIARQGGAHFL